MYLQSGDEDHPFFLAKKGPSWLFPSSKKFRQNRVAWIFSTSILPCSFGRGISILRSKRPGRNNAGSRVSGPENRHFLNAPKFSNVLVPWMHRLNEFNETHENWWNLCQSHGRNGVALQKIRSFKNRQPKKNMKIGGNLCHIRFQCGLSESFRK